MNTCYDEWFALARAQTYVEVDAFVFNYVPTK